MKTSSGQQFTNKLFNVSCYKKSHSATLTSSQNFTQSNIIIIPPRNEKHPV